MIWRQYLHCWPVDWFLHAAVFTFQRLLLEAAAQFQTRASYCKQSDFPCFCVRFPTWELSIFFMEGLCCDWEPLLWTLMIWIPGSRLFKPQLLWDRQFGLFRIYPFPVPCPSPSLSSSFYPWLSKKLADMIIHRTEPWKSDSKAKENLLHIIFIISIFIIWQLQVSSSNSFIRC